MQRAAALQSCRDKTRSTFLLLGKPTIIISCKPPLQHYLRSELQTAMPPVIKAISFLILVTFAQARLGRHTMVKRAKNANAVVKCANPYGNPCGPGSICTEIGEGFTCSPMEGIKGCPVGCGPHSTCKKNDSVFTCECDSGFHRPNPYLGCVLFDGVLP